VIRPRVIALRDDVLAGATKHKMDSILSQPEKPASGTALPVMILPPEHARLRRVDVHGRAPQGATLGRVLINAQIRGPL
jgi:hypothetical protein